MAFPDSLLIPDHSHWFSAKNLSFFQYFSRSTQREHGKDALRAAAKQSNALSLQLKSLFMDHQTPAANGKLQTCLKQVQFSSGYINHHITLCFSITTSFKEPLLFSQIYDFDSTTDAHWPMSNLHLQGQVPPP